MPSSSQHSRALAHVRRAAAHTALVLLLVAALLSTPFVLAQRHVAPAQHTAKTVVKSSDDSGAALANVNVQVLAHGQVVRSVTTDASGRAEFAALPDGNYDIVAAKQGFQTARQMHIAVQSGSLAELEVVLSPILVTEQVVSVTAAPEAELATPASESIELSREQIKLIPGRPTTVQDALPLVPGVIKAADGQIQISGMNEHHSAFLVNGADTTDPVTGQFGLTLPIDSVQTLEVLKTPYEAQYGGFTAGVVAIDTRRGAEKWDFEFNDPTPEFRIRSGHIVGLREFTPRLSATGPLRKDKLFLSQAFTYNIEKHAVRTLQFPFNESRNEYENSFTQLDYLASPTHITSLTLHVAPQKKKYANLDFFNPQPVTPDYDSQNYTATVLDRAQLRSGLLQSTLSATKVQAEVDPQSKGPMFLTPGGNFGNYFSSQERSALRFDSDEVFSLSPWKRWGTHNVQVGSEFAFTGARVHVRDRRINILDQQQQLLRSISFTDPGAATQQVLQSAGFAQDHWQPGKSLAFDLGLRMEHDTMSSLLRWAPRLGMQWHPFAAKGTTIKGGYGIFYDHVPLNIALFERWPEEMITTFQPATGYAGAMQHLRNRLRSHRRSRSLVKLNLDDDDFTFAPRSKAWNVQLEQSVRPWMQLTAGYSESHSSDLILLLPETTTSGDSLTLRDEGRARYRQFELGSRTQFKKAQMSFSYVRSHAEGDLNEFDNFLGSFPVPTVPKNRYDTLYSDVPNRFIAFGDFQLPKKIRINPLVEFRTGFPFQSRDVLQNFVAATKRYPEYFSLDTRVGRKFQVTQKYALNISVSATNITNHFNALQVHSNTADPLYGKFFGSYDRRARLDFDVDF